MNSRDNFVGIALRQSIANAGGRYSTHFMNLESIKENPSRRNALEESVRMGGYDVNISKPVKSKTDVLQPVAGSSDFWIC